MPPTRAGPRRILLVEPDSDARIVCATILPHFGDHPIAAAAGAAEALAAARATAPDCVVLGPSLSPADRQAVTEALASDGSTRHLPIEALHTGAPTAARASEAPPRAAPSPAKRSQA